MKKAFIMKSLGGFLAVNMLCSLLTGCGGDSPGSAGADGGANVSGGSEGGSAGNAGGSGAAGGAAGQDSASVSAADGSAGSGADAEGDGQPGILDSPAYNPGDRQVLTVVVAFPWPDDLQEILEYNAGSQTYFLEIKTYNNVGTEREAEKLATQLNLEILSGKGPDLVLWNRFYTPALASEKLMVDLYDFMDRDPDFHREDYYGNILEAFERNGGLYVLPASFSVYSLCGKAEELGADRGVTESWELGEMAEIFGNNSHAEMFSEYPNKEYTLRYVGEHCLGNFVDWDTGECSFDTPEFVKLLELCHTLPDGFDMPPYGESFEYMRSGKIFCAPVGLNSPWSVAAQRARFGGDLVWPGIPVENGEKDLGGGVASPGSASFSICRNSGNQEAAWEFIKSTLTPEVQREMGGVPLLRSASEEKIQEALTPEYETVDGRQQEKVRLEIITEGEETIELTCATEGDAEVFRSIIENTHRSTGEDSGMMEIIMEEAGSYFAGDKDAATVADIIQNRVSIYVGERMK